MTESRTPPETPPRSPEPASGGHPAATAVVLDFVGGTVGQADELRRRLGLLAGGPGLFGSLFSWTRASADGVRIVEVWQTRHHFDYFFQTELLPEAEAIGMPAPVLTTYDVHSYLTSGPDAALDLDAWAQLSAS